MHAAAFTDARCRLHAAVADAAWLPDRRRRRRRRRRLTPPRRPLCVRAGRRLTSRSH